MARLTLRYHDDELSTHKVLDIPLTAGRAADADIMIESPAVAEYHCRIERREGGFMVIDLKSDLGTRLNGRRVEEAALQSGDQIGLGPYTILFMDSSDSESGIGFLGGGEEQTMRYDLKDATGQPAGTTWCVRIRDAEEDIAVRLVEPYTILGAAEFADILLQGKGIAPCHAVLLRNEFGIRIVNVARKGTLLVNGRDAGRRTVLSDGDTITIGTCVIKLHRE